MVKKLKKSSYGTNFNVRRTIGLKNAKKRTANGESGKPNYGRGVAVINFKGD